MLELRATIELNTPALGGGSEPRKADPYTPFRPSAVRGALRAWFRAAVAGSLWPDPGPSRGAQKQRDEEMLQHLRELEDRVFGSTELGSSIVLAPPRGGHIKPWSPQPDGTSGLGYLGYGVFDGRSVPPESVSTREGRPLELRFGIRPRGDAETKLSPEQLLPILVSSLWLWCAFGGVGARWRRGFGSIRLSKLEVDRDSSRCDLLRAFEELLVLPANHEQHLAALQRGLGLSHDAVARLCEATGVGGGLLRNNAVRPHPHVRSLAGIKNLRTLVPTTPNALDALDAAGRLLRGFRSTLERETPLPDYEAVKASIRDRRPPKVVARAAFGLPLAFYFRSLGKKKARFVPTPPQDVDAKRVDRVPSPLIIRVHALGNPGRKPVYGVTLINLAGQNTTPLLGCGVGQARVGQGIEPPANGALLDQFIEHAVAESKSNPRIMAPQEPASRHRRRRR